MNFLRLANGEPSADAVRRIVEAVNPDQMRASLAVCKEDIVSSKY